MIAAPVLSLQAAVGPLGPTSYPSKPNGADSDSRPSRAEALGEAALSPDSILRKRCLYCAVPHMTDGLGPLLPGELASDGLCPAAFAREMDKLDRAGAPK